MTDKCPSCGKPLGVYSADEGTCSYLPCGCQRETVTVLSERVHEEIRERDALRKRVAELEHYFSKFNPLQAQMAEYIVELETREECVSEYNWFDGKYEYGIFRFCDTSIHSVKRWTRDGDGEDTETLNTRGEWLAEYIEVPPDVFHIDKDALFAMLRELGLWPVSAK